MNTKTSRENHLLQMLGTAGRVSTAQAVQLLGVSEATARRIFAAMEKDGKIIRNYGGIQLPSAPDDYSFEANEKSHGAEKLRIGRQAAALVRDGETMYMDCGTTLIQMALSLGERIAQKDVRSLNIITNSIANIQALGACEGCHVILAGGEYNYGRRDFSGYITEKNIGPFHFDRCFLGCDGVTASTGFSSSQISLSNLNANVLSRSHASAVLADASKFGHSAFMSYAALADVGTLITDRPPEEPLAAALMQSGTQVLVATNERSLTI